MEGNKGRRGGPQPGSGRPRIDVHKKFKTISISGSPEEIELIQERAKASGKSVSRYIIDIVMQ